MTKKKFEITKVEEYHYVDAGVLQVWGEEVSDGYHTMHELYQHRMALFAALCNIISLTEDARIGRSDYSGYLHKHYAWKSKLHSDGTVPFDDNRYFVAGIQSPHGQITYHMKIDEWWDRFRVIELEHAPEYDGHTSEDVIIRLLAL